MTRIGKQSAQPVPPLARGRQPVVSFAGKTDRIELSGQELGSIKSARGLKNRLKLGVANTATYIGKQWHGGLRGKLMLAYEVGLGLAASTLPPLSFGLYAFSPMVWAGVNGFRGKVIDPKTIHPDKTDKSDKNEKQDSGSVDTSDKADLILGSEATN